MQSGVDRLERALRVLEFFGVLYVLVVLVQVATSFGFAAVATHDDTAWELDAYRRLGEGAAVVSEGVGRWLSGDSPFRDTSLRVWTYALPVGVQSILCVALLALVAYVAPIDDGRFERQLTRFALISSAVASLGMPMLVCDLWWYAGYGRAIADGVNPYHEAIPAASLDGVPVPFDHMQQYGLPYGPLYGLVLGAVGFVARNHLWLHMYLLKLLALGATAAAILLVPRVMRDAPAQHRMIATIVVGWMPLSITQGLIDGHNDTLVGALLLGWLLLLQSRSKRRAWWATPALAASVLVKYVTLPFGLLDLLHHRWGLLRAPRTYGARLGLAALLSVAVAAALVRGPEFIQSVTKQQSAAFFRPQDAFLTFHYFTGRNIHHADVVAGALPLVVLVVAFVGWWRAPDDRRFRHVVTASMLAILYSVMQHVHPWFVLWLVAVGATVVGTWIGRWVFCFALGTPFFVVGYLFRSGDSAVTWELPTMGVYLVVFVLFFAIPERWLPSRDYLEPRHGLRVLEPKNLRQRVRARAARSPTGG